MTRKFFPVSQPSITALECEYVQRAMSSGWISSLGEFVDQFESRFAEFCGSNYAIAVSNGTVALQLALASLRVGAGDEVIVPDLSFIATANAVLHAGATPVFADVDPETLCLDPAALSQVATSRTKAIIPVHLYGHPAEMNGICDFAARHDLFVIEDAAESHGAQVHGRTVGSIGACGCFSFYGNKILTTGEGGMVTTNDRALNARLRHLRDHAMSADKRYWHVEPGFNFRLTNIQAAIGCAQLDRAASLLAKRRTIFEWYSEHLAGEPGLILNRQAGSAQPTYWMVCMECLGFDAAMRDDFMSRLRKDGVDSRPFFYPMSEMPYFEPAHTPNAHLAAGRGITLPTYFELNYEDVASICDVIKAVWHELVAAV